MKKIFYIANWKMNKNVSEGLDFIENFLSEYKKSYDTDIVICPSIITLSKLDSINKVQNFEAISFGAQNVNDHEEGAFTGEVCANMLKDLICSYCIVGHSERRSNYKETNANINNKIKLLIKSNIIPILCVGESWDQKESKTSNEAISNQLKHCLEDVPVSDIIIAYEPIWAIGSGQSANVQDISDMNNVIKKQMNKLGYMDDQFYILYGGSVDINNVKVLRTADYINGFLIGGASLELDNFLELIKG